MGTNTLKQSTSAVVLAAGSSTRMEAKKNKVLMDLEGATILEHSLRIFAGLEEISEIVLVVSAQDRKEFTGGFLQQLETLGVKKIVDGGARRFDSALNGVFACTEDSRLILIHDGARPFPPVMATRDAIHKASSTGAAILAIPLQDTLKRLREGSVIRETISRERLFQAQTPQIFQKSILQSAMLKAKEDGLSPTDDAMVLEAAGHEVVVLEGSPYNMKITTQEDLQLARALLQAQRDHGAMT